jgi:hypothetical protein
LLKRRNELVDEFNKEIARIEEREVRRAQVKKQLEERVNKMLVKDQENTDVEEKNPFLAYFGGTLLPTTNISTTTTTNETVIKEDEDEDEDEENTDSLLDWWVENIQPYWLPEDEELFQMDSVLTLKEKSLPPLPPPPPPPNQFFKIFNTPRELLNVPMENIPKMTKTISGVIENLRLVKRFDDEKPKDPVTQFEEEKNQNPAYFSKTQKYIRGLLDCCKLGCENTEYVTIDADEERARQRDYIRNTQSSSSSFFEYNIDSKNPYF